MRQNFQGVQLPQQVPNLRTGAAGWGRADRQNSGQSRSEPYPDRDRRPQIRYDPEMTLETMLHSCERGLDNQPPRGTQQIDRVEAGSNNPDHAPYYGCTTHELGRSSIGGRISEVAAAMSQISSNPSSTSQSDSTWILEGVLNFGREHGVPDLAHTVMDL